MMIRPGPTLLLALLAALILGCGGGGSSSTSGDATDEPGVGIPEDPGTEVPGTEDPVDDSLPGDTTTAPVARPIDGTDAAFPGDSSGSAGSILLRLARADYADGLSSMAGPDRASARAVSNTVFAQEEPVPNAAGLTDYVWQWGQFLDHDISLTPEAAPEERADISVPAFDPWFDPNGTGAVTLPFHRAAYADSPGVRQQLNAITAFVDASNVYGSDPERAAALRAFDGSGRLLTSAGDLLPRNETGLPNAGGTDAALFLAGDVRANEQVGLTAMHTLFLREHNRRADEIRARRPDLSGDEIYEEARRFVGALMQVITYREFLPALLGPDPLPPYEGYRPEVDPSISNEFSTGCYRLGHSMLSPVLLRIDADGEEIAEGNLSLRDAFFNPGLLVDGEDLDPVLRGLAAQSMQEVDALVIDDVRNFLFGAPGSGGLDLAALNIQRGRDHGLPPMNEVREAHGLPRIASFEELTSDPDLQARLSSVYASVDEVEVWVGALAEDDLPEAAVGSLLTAALRDQFARLRDGDPFWYERIFTPAEMEELESTRLSDVIRRNTGIGGEIQDDVFRLDAATSPPTIRIPLSPRELDGDRRRRIELGMGTAR